MGCWQKQHDFKPSANIPISTTLRPSSHDTSRSNIVLAGPFSPSEHCWLTTRNFSAHDFRRFSSPPFMNLPLLLILWLCVADVILYKLFLARTSRTRARNAYVRCPETISANVLNCAHVIRSPRSKQEITFTFCTGLSIHGKELVSILWRHWIKKIPDLASTRFRIHSAFKNFHSGVRIQTHADSHGGCTGLKNIRIRVI